MKRVSLKKSGIIIVFGFFTLYVYGQENPQKTSQTIQDAPKVKLAANQHTQVLSINNKQNLTYVVSNSVYIGQKSQPQQIINVVIGTEENVKVKKQARVNWFGNYLLAKIASKFTE
ncbi:hypothetical protein SAMN05216436_11835 [bacterium A37T11]|nr:hypothetical protein SAMN05216436_11835 [bacterium A37T11]